MGITSFGVTPGNTFKLFLARNIKKAREEHARGETQKGNVDDLMKDLSK